MKNKEAAANLFNPEEWPNQHLREAVIRKLDDELARNPHFVPGNSQQVEEVIFQKSKDQVDYRRRVQKFINVITSGPGCQPIPPYEQPMGAAAAAATSSTTSSEAPTTSLGSGNESSSFFEITNFATDEVEMNAQEPHNGLPFDPYTAVRQPHHHLQQTTPAAAQAPPQHLQQQQQHPIYDGVCGAPQQYPSTVHNPYQMYQQPAGSNTVRMQPQGISFSNGGALPAPGTADYQLMYHNRLLGLRPYCERLRFKIHQYQFERNADAAVQLDMMVNVLEGRQVVSLEYLLNMERWILSKADQGAI